RLPTPRTRFRNRCRTEVASTKPCARGDQLERIRDTLAPYRHVRNIGKYHMHAHDALKRGAGGLQHMLHIAERCSNLFGDRPMIALTGLRIDRTHAREEYVVADANTWDMRQVGVAGYIELRIPRLNHGA